MICKKYRSGRVSPYEVQWTSLAGKRRCRFFSDEGTREAFIEKLAPTLADKQDQLLELSPFDQVDVLKVFNEKGDLSFTELWKFWQDHHKAREIVSVWDGCDHYVRHLKNERGFSRDHLTHVRLRLERFCAQYGDSPIENITRKDMEFWLDALPFQGYTKKNYHDSIRAAWSYFLKKEWAEKNVAAGISTGRVENGDIGILTVDEVKQLLRTNEKVDPEVCGLMALGLFAGMRSSAICRVSYDEINFQEKGIETPAEKTKKKRRQFIEHLPDNLWAWLERTPKSAFEMTERQYKYRRTQAYRRAGLMVLASDVKQAAKKGIKLRQKMPPHNAMRHSFVSYHVALYRNFTDTALIISHRGTNVLFEHYLGVAKKEDAKRYFAIYPEGWKTP